MREAIVGLICLLVGVGAMFGYEHFQGVDVQRTDALQQLANAQVKLAQAQEANERTSKENVALTDQVQQLSASKDQLTKQLAQTPAPASAPANPFAGPGMANIMKMGVEQRSAARLQLLTSRLHLTPDQVTALKAAMDAESTRAEAITAKMFSGGKIDPQAMADMKGKSADQTLDEILTPDQKVTYQQIKSDEKSSAAEMMASVEMNQVAPALQLSDSQKDQVATAFYQVQLDSQDPSWIKNNSPTPTDPTAILDAQAKAKEDALAKILTADQLATYHQQAQSQLDMQRAMMQKMMPAQPAAAAPAPASAPASTPAPAPTP